MRKKEHWMKIGNPVIAMGSAGFIVAMQQKEKEGIEYVSLIDVKLLGRKFSNPYHPSDVQEGKIVKINS